MKTKNLLGFALFLTITALLSGCGKTDSNLESENAGLKARVQKLEQQLQASNSQTASPASPQSQSASTQDLKSQLDEAQKKADAAADELKSVSSQVDTLNQKVVALTRELSEARQARENAEKALQLYQDKATSALKQFQALRSTLGNQTAKLDGYHQNYLATQSAVANWLPHCRNPQSGARLWVFWPGSRTSMISGKRPTGKCRHGLKQPRPSMINL